MTEPAVMPLCFMRPGDTGVLVDVRERKHRPEKTPPDVPSTRHTGRLRSHGHGTDSRGPVERRLHAMGLVPGAPVKLLRNDTTGPVIVAVKDTRLAIARAIAARIMVQPDRTCSAGGEAEAGSEGR